MIRVNLLERIIVEKPFERTSFGWTVYTNKDLVRRRIFAQSINAFVKKSRQVKPSLLRAVRRGGFFDSVLTDKGLNRFKRGRELHEYHIRLSTFKTSHDLLDLEHRQDAQESTGLDLLIRGLNETFSDRGVRFDVKNLPLAPRSFFRAMLHGGRQSSDAKHSDDDQLKFRWN